MMSGRTYIIFDDVLRDKTLIPYCDKCVGAIEKGDMRVSKTRAKAGYPSYPCFRIDGKEILVEAVLEYYLFRLQRSGFISKDAEEFTDKMRILCGWHWGIDRTSQRWIERVIRNPFFHDVNDSEFDHKWVLRNEDAGYALSEEYFKYACYLAVCFTKHGHSWDKKFSEEIFSFVTALGSSLPAQIKKNGSGDLPKEISQHKTDDCSCVANDAFATIKISVKKECEESYRQVMDYLCRLLEFGFPKSYSIEFRSSNKSYLPIKKLPKKGINQLFANAMLYPNLYDRIEKYARLAMKEFEWYNNLKDEFCAMPGTFAVFGLGLIDEKYHQLARDYLSICDGEHQSLQGNFVLAYIEKYGFTAKGLELYRLCEENIQHLPTALVALYSRKKF